MLYTVVDSEEFQKVLCYYLSDDKKLNKATILCNILYLLDDLDKGNEMPTHLLKRIYDLVDGCSAQYRYGTVLYLLDILAKDQEYKS